MKSWKAIMLILHMKNGFLQQQPLAVLQVGYEEIILLAAMGK